MVDPDHYEYAPLTIELYLAAITNLNLTCQKVDPQRIELTPQLCVLTRLLH